MHLLDETCSFRFNSFAFRKFKTEYMLSFFFFLFQQSQKEGRRHLVYNNNTFSAAILTADMKKKGKKMLFKVWVGQMFKGSKGRI